MAKTITVVIIVVLLGVGGYLVYRQYPSSAEDMNSVNNTAALDDAANSAGGSATDGNAGASSNNTGVDDSPDSPDQSQGTPSDTVAAKTVTVVITDTGYSPQEVTINKGDSVKWVNQSSAANWPASAMHPTHAGYPTTGGCIASTFDACKGLVNGETWIFQFDLVGSWGYHDHLNPKFFGKVIVK